MEDAFDGRLVSTLGQRLHPGQDIGVVRRDIVLFTHVVRQIVKFPVGVLPRSDRLPIRHAHGGLPTQLPVEEFMFLLLPSSGVFPEKLRHNRQAIDIFGRFAPANSATVGNTSGKYQRKSLTRPEPMCPGQRTIIGMRSPPSYRLPFLPRNSTFVSGWTLRRGYRVDVVHL